MRLEIDLPNGRWFKGDWLIRPKVDSFCVIIVKDEKPCADNLYLAQYIGGDIFELDGIEDDMHIKNIDWWQPVDLPAEFERQLNDV